MPVFWDMGLRSASTYLELCELLIRIQMHIAVPGVYECREYLYSIRIIDCFITNKQTNTVPLYNYCGAHICF